MIMLKIVSKLSTQHLNTLMLSIYFVVLNNLFNIQIDRIYVDNINTILISMILMNLP